MTRCRACLEELTASSAVIGRHVHASSGMFHRFGVNSWRPCAFVTHGLWPGESTMVLVDCYAYYEAFSGKRYYDDVE